MSDKKGRDFVDEAKQHMSTRPILQEIKEPRKRLLVHFEWQEMQRGSINSGLKLMVRRHDTK